MTALDNIDVKPVVQNLSVDMATLPEDITALEGLLETLCTASTKMWGEIYIILEKVEQAELWKNTGAHSFSAWVKMFVADKKLHESVIWKYRKAGRFYRRYQERMEKLGKTTAKINELTVSPATLGFIEKLARGDEGRENSLIKQVFDGNVTEKEMRNVWKAERARLGDSIVRKNAKPLDPVADEPATMPTMTAADILLALNDSSWLNSHIPQNRFLLKGEKLVYRSLPEFPVETGETRHARRIDSVIIENYTVKDRVNYNVILHGIEIKVNQYDLLGDNKMTEYMDFVDFLYFAVPDSLADLAVSESAPPVGVLSVDVETKEISIVKEAMKLDAIMRDETLMTALVKTL